MNDEYVNHPPHYNDGAHTILKDGTALYEPIKVIEDWQLGFCQGNALKYIIRAQHKGALKQDLHKALWYLERWKPPYEFQPTQHTISWEDVARDWCLADQLAYALKSIQAAASEYSVAARDASRIQAVEHVRRALMAIKLQAAR